jgi:hypothetical protein
MAGRKSFLVFCDRSNELDLLTDEQVGRLFRALIKYVSLDEDISETEDIAVKLLFSVMKSAIDENNAKYENKCKKNAENVRKRWNKNNTNVYERIPNDTKDTYTDTDTDTDTDTETNTDTDTNNTLKSINKTPKPQKHKYGEYQHVLLTDDEHSRLVSDFGSDVTDRYIKKVDEYCEQSGKTYKNYNLAIRNTFMSRDNVKPKEQKRDIFSLPDEQLTEQERIIKKLRC